jgi:hypothetical protein
LNNGETIVVSWLECAGHHRQRRKFRQIYSTGPLATLIQDLLSLVIYLAIATAMLR